MNSDLLMLFDKTPDALPLYQQLEDAIMARFPEITNKVGKTQVSFYNTHGFVWLWPPVRRRKGWPKFYVGVSFGLNHPIEDPRIAVVVEPYPNRFTHHVLVEKEVDIDEQLLAWIDESYQFSLTKR